MTVGRIDHNAAITSERLHTIEAAATRAWRRDRAVHDQYRRNQRHPWRESV